MLPWCRNQCFIYQLSGFYLIAVLAVNTHDHSNKGGEKKKKIWNFKIWYAMKNYKKHSKTWYFKTKEYVSSIQAPLQDFQYISSDILIFWNFRSENKNILRIKIKMVWILRTMKLKFVYYAIRVYLVEDNVKALKSRKKPKKR